MPARTRNRERAIAKSGGLGRRYAPRVLIAAIAARLEVGVMASTLYDMRYWAQVHDVIANRCKIVNQLHHCQYERNHANPCRLDYCGGTYEMLVYGEVVTTYRLYDVEGTQRSLELADLVTNLLWLGCSQGFMTLSPTTRAVPW